jgi:hypothetical protein
MPKNYKTKLPTLTVFEIPRAMFGVWCFDTPNTVADGFKHFGVWKYCLAVYTDVQHMSGVIEHYDLYM